VVVDRDEPQVRATQAQGAIAFGIDMWISVEA